MERLRNARKRKEASPPTSTLQARNRSPGFLQRLSRPASPFRRSPTSVPQSPSTRSISDQAGASTENVDEVPPSLPEDATPAVGQRAAKPAFLRLSDEDILLKFYRINEEDDHRYLSRTHEPAQWARPQVPEDSKLDRYSNVHPWEYNRIRLQVPAGKLDYINASPITLRNDQSGSSCSYVAMQGPKQNSVDHVWRMIWDTLPDPAVIVMLTVTHEAGAEKCYPYFPQRETDPPLVVNEDDEHEDGFKATVELQQIDRQTAGAATVLEVRRMVMTLDEAYAAQVNATQTSKEVIHYLYRAWPDFGTPEGKHLRFFFDVMQLSQSHHEDAAATPKITHCSAGVGRTGTFIALDFLLRELEAGVLDPAAPTTLAAVTQATAAEPGAYPATTALYSDDDPNVDIIYMAVNALRQQRRYMVQSREQFVFLYKIMDALWTMKYHDAPAPERGSGSSTPAGTLSAPAATKYLAALRRLHFKPRPSAPVAETSAPSAAAEPSTKPAGPTVWDLACMLAMAQEDRDDMTDDEEDDTDEHSPTTAAGEGED